MEGKVPSMTITRIHGLPVTQPLRMTPFGRSFALTTDGRQWTMHNRDRNKAHGGWVEFNPDSAKPERPSKEKKSTHLAVKGDGRTRSDCELCTIATGYGDEDVDGELQLQLVIMFHVDCQMRHWGLFIGREAGKGEMLQVKGDLLKMHYASEPTTNLFADDNYLITRIYTIAGDLTAKQVLLIKEAASSVRPPSSPSVEDIKGHCQTWCCDVLSQLVRMGIANEDHVWKVKVDAKQASLPPYEDNKDMRMKAMVEGEWTWVTKNADNEIVSDVAD